PGTLFAGLFVLFVPNIAEQVSKGLAQAVYGIILIAVIFLMPSGAAGFVRMIARRMAIGRGVSAVPDRVDAFDPTKGLFASTARRLQMVGQTIRKLAAEVARW